MVNEMTLVGDDEDDSLSGTIPSGDGCDICNFSFMTENLLADTTTPSVAAADTESQSHGNSYLYIVATAIAVSLFVLMTCVIIFLSRKWAKERKLKSHCNSGNQMTVRANDAEANPSSLSTGNNKGHAKIQSVTWTQSAEPQVQPSMWQKSIDNNTYDKPAISNTQTVTNICEASSSLAHLADSGQAVSVNRVTADIDCSFKTETTDHSEITNTVKDTEACTQEEDSDKINTQRETDGCYITVVEVTDDTAPYEVTDLFHSAV